MKKKFLATLMALTMVAAIGLTGCGSSKDKKSSDEKTEDKTSTESSVDLSVETLRKDLLADIETEVELGDYKAITVEVEEIVVTDEDVQEAIDYDLESMGTATQITEGTVADGDTLNIDYVGKVDGEEIENGSEEDASLTIGSDAFIDGFEDALIGKTIGETTTINVTFPEDYSTTDLAGKAAEFTVTINYKEGDIIPAELTDELVVEMALGDEITTVDAYKTYVRETLEENAASSQETENYNAIVEKLNSICTVNSYDDDLNKDTLYEEEMAYMEEYAAYYSTTLDELIALYYDMTLEEYEADLAESIQSYVTQTMVYRAIVNAEGIDVTQEEFDAKLAEYSADYESYGLESVEAFEETYGTQIYELMLYEKVDELLTESSTVNYVEATDAAE